MNLQILASIGEELKKHRKSAGLSLEQIAGRLKIRQVYLQAIETGTEKSLPALPYVIGYIKQYAKHLDVDVSKLLNQLKAEQMNDKLTSGASKNLITPEKFLPSWMVIWVSLLFLLLIYFLAAYFF